MSPRHVWGGALGTLVAYDLYCDRNTTTGDTLSEVTRDVFAVHTPAGRAVFLAAWVLLSGWFLPHILRKAASST